MLSLVHVYRVRVTGATTGHSCPWYTEQERGKRVGVRYAPGEGAIPPTGGRSRLRARGVVSSARRGGLGEELARSTDHLPPRLATYTILKGYFTSPIIVPKVLYELANVSTYSI